MLGAQVFAPALRQRHRAALSLHVEIAGAVTKSATNGRGNFAKGSPVTRIEGCRCSPVTFGDADEEVDRATAAAQVASELETAVYRIHVRAAQLIAVHYISMASRAGDLIFTGPRGLFLHPW
jgi:hypothetical protein